MIIVRCDVCKKEVDDNDFACDIKILEIKIMIGGNDLNSQKIRSQNMYQLCRNCFSKHLAKLFNEK